MKWIVFLLTAALLLAPLAGCSNPKDRFIDAAARQGTVSDRKVLACAADRLQKKLSKEEFDQLVEELEKISDKKMKASDASVKLMGAMTVATGACAVGDLLGLGGGKEK